MTDEFVVFVNGVYGTGKTSTLEHLADAMAGAGRPFALFDVDWFHRAWPPAEHDPDNVLVEAENIAAVWSHYRRSGFRRPFVSGVAMDAGDTARYAGAFGLPVRAVLLTASPAVLRGRLTGRYSAEQSDALRWHLDRVDADAERIAAGGQYELMIDTDERRPADVARTVLDHFALLDDPPAPARGPGAC